MHGDLRSKAWYGRETVPQRGHTAWTGVVAWSVLWHCLPTMPPVRPKVSWYCRGRHGGSWSIADEADVVAWSPDHATGPTEGLLGTVERQQQLVVRCGISRAWGGSVLAVQARLRRTRDPRGGRPVVERVTRSGHRPTTWTAGDDCTTGDLRSRAWHGPETVPQRDRGDDCTTGDPRSKAWDGRETVPQRGETVPRPVT